MAIMLKIRWDIKSGQEADFKANQQTLCAVMLEHPGVIAYHAEYPSPGVSEWTEIYANDDAFAAHLMLEDGHARFEVRGLDIGDEPPFEPGSQPLFEGRDLLG